MISKTQYISYLENPEKYKETTNRNTEVTEKMKKGTMIHNIYERFPSYVELGENKLEIRKDRLPSQIIEDSEMWEMFTTLHYFENQRYQKILEKDLSIEKYFEALTREEKLYIQEHNMLGIPDAVFREQNGGVVVVDLKTEFYSDYHLNEMAFYKELVEHNFPFTVTKGVVLAVGEKLGNENPKIFGEEQLNQVNVKQDVQRVIEEINNNPELPNVEV